MHARVRFVVLALSTFLALPFLPSVARAQTTNATLSGQVTDTSGAAVPNATVVAVNEATNVRYETKTNNDGIYVEPNLPPGTYHMEITKDGFKRVMQPGIELHVEDARAANYTLQVGALSETVTVQANSYMMNTQDGTVSTTIDRNFAENLPLNGRSFQTLLLLTPGTVLTSSNISNGNDGQFSVNGQRANANSFAVDGVSANTATYSAGASIGAQLNGSNPSYTVAGTTQGLVSVDALQEFKIQTSTYAPEFGRQPGGQVSLLTRSGTNAFHGTAFDYFRNDVLDANNWFNKCGCFGAPVIPRGAERQNDFGGTVGGPVIKDKTFFFFSYEGLRLLQPTTYIETVPSLRLRQEAAPAFQKILNSWPIPDGPESVDSTGTPTGVAPYTFAHSQPTSMDSYGIRVDHTFGRFAHLFGRFAKSSSDVATNNSNSPVENKTELKSRSLTLGVDSAIRPDLANELRLNYTVNVSRGSFGLFEIGGGQAFDTSVLFPPPLKVGADYGYFELDEPGGTLSLVVGQSGKFSQRQVNITDGVAYSAGQHQIKWGIDYRRLFPIYAPSPLNGQYYVTSDTDLVAGNTSFALSASTLDAHPIYTNFSAYGQDAWRMSNRITVTYGLRWELNPPPGERDGIFPFNVVGIENPATASLAPLNSPLYHTSYDNFAPRLGIAYQLRSTTGRETVLRGGLGIFYDLNSETTATGYNNGLAYENSSDIFTGKPFPIAADLLPVPPLPVPLNPPYRLGSAVDPNLKLPSTLHWNVSLEQGLGSGQSLTISYVAAAGYRLLRSDELVNFNPNFRRLTVVRNSSSSNYESLQLQFRRSLSRRWQAVASYTYSHSIDNSSDGENVDFATSVLPNPNLDRGNSDFDLRHAFRAATTYNVPTWNTNAFSRAVLGGWSADAIALAQTGLPVNLTGGGIQPPPAFLNGSGQLRPDVVPRVPLYINNSAAPGGWQFNPAAFKAVPTDSSGYATRQGDFGRNILRGFGAWQIDFALHRQFNFGERMNLQLRSEFFNLFNHPNFGGVNNFIGGSTFGQANSTLNHTYGAGLNYLYAIGGPRSIQLALKLVF